MRKLILFTLISFVSIVGFSQEKDRKSASASIYFRMTGIDFGKIPQNKPVTHDFWLINQSKAPVSIQNVMASCGCTTPEYSSSPIAPGDSTAIRVGFNAAAEGAFNRGINILLNTGQLEQIYVSGVVYSLPTQPAPKNKIIEQIKSQN